MDLTNTFDVDADIETTWTALTDIELIAPCMPGATLTEVEGDTYRGTVKIKVGPITATFKGHASFTEQDDDAHRAVLKASGRDTSGKGNANATITAELSEADSGGGTHVSIVTDLSISGKVAQFGRSALADISTKLIDQFASCLETKILGSGTDGDVVSSEESEDDAGGPATQTNEDAEDGAVAFGRSKSSTSNVSGSPVDTATSTESQGPRGSSVPKSPGATGAPTGARRIDAPEAEPIDLLETAGAPMLARVVPAVVGLVLILWLIRRRRP